VKKKGGGFGIRTICYLFRIPYYFLDLGFEGTGARLEPVFSVVDFVRQVSVTGLVWLVFI
jgi:hypothetical protein